MLDGVRWASDDVAGEAAGAVDEGVLDAPAGGVREDIPIGVGPDGDVDDAVRATATGVAAEAGGCGADRCAIIAIPIAATPQTASTTPAAPQIRPRGVGRARVLMVTCLLHLDGAQGGQFCWP